MAANSTTDFQYLAKKYKEMAEMYMKKYKEECDKTSRLEFEIAELQAQLASFNLVSYQINQMTHDIVSPEVEVPPITSNVKEKVHQLEKSHEQQQVKTPPVDAELKLDQPQLKLDQNAHIPQLPPHSNQTADEQVQLVPDIEQKIALNRQNNNQINQQQHIRLFNSTKILAADRINYQVSSLIVVQIYQLPLLAAYSEQLVRQSSRAMEVAVQSVNAWLRGLKLPRTLRWPRADVRSHPGHERQRMRWLQRRRVGDKCQQSRPIRAFDKSVPFLAH